jgi:hypothetical protein
MSTSISTQLMNTTFSTQLMSIVAYRDIVISKVTESLSILAKALFEWKYKVLEDLLF